MTPKTARPTRPGPDPLAAARRIETEMVRTRREIHAHPEIGRRETETCRLVRERLKALGLKPAVMAKTGVTALIDSGRPGPVLMLRCDLDALPIREETGLPFASRNPEAMHACGHDFHTAALLGVARLLVESPPTRGAVKLNFQPGEEGFNGAGAMIEAGIMERPKVDAALGLHIWQGFPAGTISVEPGPVMAAADEFVIRIHGRAGHAAYPHQAVDPVLIAGHVVTALQSIASRSVDPLDSVVVTVAAIHGGTAFNIIPPMVEMKGTVRTFSKAVRRAVPRRLAAITRQVAAAFGGRAEIEYTLDTPAVVNDPKMSEFVRRVAADVVGARNLVRSRPSMGGEDFACYLEKVPGCFFFVGSGGAGEVFPHHHPKFNPEEAALTVGAAVLFEAARRWVETA